LIDLSEFFILAVGHDFILKLVTSGPGH